METLLFTFLALYILVDGTKNFVFSLGNVGILIGVLIFILSGILMIFCSDEKGRQFFGKMFKNTRNFLVILLLVGLVLSMVNFC